MASLPTTEAKEFRDVPDYAALTLPDDKPKPEWGWQHRRAFIHRRLMDVGHHTLLNKTELARKFDVTRKVIYDDLDRLAEYITEDFDPERHKSETIAVFDKCVAELLDEGRYKDAAKVRAQFDEWRERRGDMDRENNDLDINIDADGEALEFLDEVF